MDSSTNVVFSHLICHPKEVARPQPAQRRQDCQGDKVKNLMMEKINYIVEWPIKVKKNSVITCIHNAVTGSVHYNPNNILLKTELHSKAFSYGDFDHIELKPATVNECHNHDQQGLINIAELKDISPSFYLLKTLFHNVPRALLH